jgi:hypothetical protein
MDSLPSFVCGSWFAVEVQAASSSHLTLECRVADIKVNKIVEGMEANAAILGYLLATVLVAIMLVPSLADSVGNKTLTLTQAPGRQHFTTDPLMQRLDSIAISGATSC